MIEMRPLSTTMSDDGSLGAFRQRRPRGRSVLPRRGPSVAGAWYGLLLAWIVSWAPAVLAQQAEDPQLDRFSSALAAAGPGDTVEVPAGTYSRLRLAGMAFPSSAPLVIRPADPLDPPRFSSLDLQGVSNVILDGVIFDDIDDQADARFFVVSGSQGVIVRNCLFDGRPDRDGYGTGVGFYSIGNTRIRFEDNEVRGFLRGAMFVQTDGVTVRGNDLHGLRSDGLNFVQVTDVLVEGNRVRDFHKRPESGDHPDMIQFWTAGTDAPSSDIVIRNNLLLAGAGGWTQTIFIGNELVAQGVAGAEMFYRNVTIEGNLIVNAHLHGITVGGADGLVIRNNTVVRNPAAEGPDDNVALWTPAIWLSAGSRNVSVLDNVTGGLVLPHPLPGDWNSSGNLTVQDRSRLEPAFYGTVFAGLDAMDPTSFRPRPGGPLDGAGVGSPLPAALTER